MSITIYPIKQMPGDIIIGGDYDTTQMALILGALASGETIINIYNKSLNTGRTVDFLKNIGSRVIVDGGTLRVGRGDGPTIPEDRHLTYGGDISPLSLIIGLLAGMNESCILDYGEAVNSDIIDSLTEVLNKKGIDIFHEANSRQVVFRASAEHPIEIKISSSLSYSKNCLLAFGLVSGCSVNIREFRITSGVFQKGIKRFDGDINIMTPKPEFKPDPHDPRKRIRTTSVDYKREIILGPSVRLQGQTINIPVDFDMAAALITLAVIKKKSITLPGISMDNNATGFLNHLKASGMDVKTGERKNVDGFQIGEVTVTGKEIKVRRTAGSLATSLIDEIPFLAIIAAAGKGTSVIRGVREMSESGLNPFEEITANLQKMGVKSGIMEDGLVIEGTGVLAGADFGRFENPRVGLAFLIAAMAAQERCTFDDFSNVVQHYPDTGIIWPVELMGQKTVTEEDDIRA